MKRLYRGLELSDGPKATDVAIPVETQPGEVAQVDFGYAGKRYDPSRGVLRKSWLFTRSRRRVRVSTRYSSLRTRASQKTWRSKCG